MRVSILGPLEVESDEGLVDIRGHRLRALLVRLALDAGRVVSAESLALSLWDDDATVDVTNALQSLVSRLRRALPEPSTLTSRDGGYVLSVPRDCVDAHRFTTWATEGRTALRVGDAARAADLLTRALSLWRGEALADLREIPFAALEITRLDHARAAAMEDRLEAEVQLGHGPDVLPDLTFRVEADSRQERVVGLLMRALNDAGRQADALELYERTRSLLSESLGADPSAALQQIHLDVLRGAPPTVPVPAPIAAPTNLRSTLTSFLGRDADLIRLTDLISAHRLVTLVGPGGAGKTRLALEAAALQRGSGTVWVAELAPVTSPDDIAQAVLDAIDVRDTLVLESRRLRPSRDALTQLQDVLAAGPCLLVLDNCEHLVDGAAQISGYLLARCPTLRILATSREPLAITGEVLHPLSMLVVPDEGAAPEEATATSSVQLFLARAAAVSPEFALDDGNVADVVEVCRRLDGLPLAIELAAARLRSMSVAQLAGRLDDRFRLLTGGSRTAVARHRTLRAVVEWSWDLLSPQEQRAAERFSVFPGGATAEAVAAVCFPEGATVDDAEDAMAALADKSLVQLLEPQPGRPTRYRMLETLREFGSERLAGVGDLLATRRSHAGFYRDAVERVEPMLRSEHQIDALHVVDEEHDNILAALRFSADDGDADTALRIAAAMGWYWILMDSHAEAATWMSTATSTPGEGDAQARALVTGLRAVNAVAAGFIDLGDEASLTGLLDDVPEVDPLSGHPLLALVPPLRALLSEDVEGFEAAAATSLTHPDPWARAAVHLLKVQTYENFGDVAAMHRHAELALELFRPTGDRWGVATALTSLGEILLVAEDYEGALAAHEEAYRLTTELLPRSRDNADALMHLALVHVRLADHEQASTLLHRARTGAETAGSRHHVAMIDLAQGNLARQLGDLDGARAPLDRAESQLDDSRIHIPQLEAMVHVAQAQLAVAEGNPETVPGRLATAYRLARGSRDAPIVAAVAVAAAAWRADQGDPQGAAELLGISDALRGATDSGNPDVVAVRAICVDLLGGERWQSAVGRGSRLDHGDALEELGTMLGVVDEHHPYRTVARRG